MLSQLHCKIGEKVFKAIDQEVPEIMNHNAYVLGCIAPDFLPGQPPHLKELSMEYVGKLIEGLLSYNQRVASSEGEYSFKLGMICHYICDWFCLAHNLEVYRGRWAHFLYEYKMAFNCSQFELDSILQVKSSIFDLVKPASAGSIISLINEYHNKYRSGEGIHNDLAYSLHTALKVSQNILATSLALPMNIKKTA